MSRIKQAFVYENGGIGDYSLEFVYISCKIQAGTLPPLKKRYF
jgi:hypothetical protein